MNTAQFYQSRGETFEAFGRDRIGALSAYSAGEFHVAGLASLIHAAPGIKIGNLLVVFNLNVDFK